MVFSGSSSVLLRGRGLSLNNKCYVTLFSRKFDPNSRTRNANNVEPYTFVIYNAFFSGKLTSLHLYQRVRELLEDHLLCHYVLARSLTGDDMIIGELLLPLHLLLW